MKVRVTFTVEVDPEKWAYEYGVERSEVRQDVNRYAESSLQQQIADLGLGVDR